MSVGVVLLGRGGPVELNLPETRLEIGGGNVLDAVRVCVDGEGLIGAGMVWETPIVLPTSVSSRIAATPSTETRMYLLKWPFWTPATRPAIA